MAQPRVLIKVDPVYPEDAKDEGIEGTVVLKTEITTEGVARNITVSKSLDPRFDASAVTAVSNWRFQPGTKDGQPVTVYASIEITFHLK
jgi:protein TonB